MAAVTTIRATKMQLPQSSYSFWLIHSLGFFFSGNGKATIRTSRTRGGSGHSSALVVDGNFKSLKGSCQCFLTQENLASPQFNGTQSSPGPNLHRGRLAAASHLCYSIHCVIVNLGLTGAGGESSRRQVINLVFAVIVSVLFAAMIIKRMRE